MISDIVRAIDCCGLLSRLYYPLPSFADRMVDLDHRFDNELREYYRLIEFPPHLQCYNPAPEEESAVFRQLQFTGSGNMLQRNALLCSRLFITNADVMGLALPFRNHDRVRILDCGCGNALNLMGIFAYFGINRVEYVGIDINSQQIAECTHSYRHFQNASFQLIDSESPGGQMRQLGQFDLILVQHPNLLAADKREAYLAFFDAARQFLTPQGRLYCTLYYESEAHYFIEHIMPHLPGVLQFNSSFKATLFDIHRREAYCPENYSFLSHLPGHTD